MCRRAAHRYWIPGVSVSNVSYATWAGWGFTSHLSVCQLMASSTTLLAFEKRSQFVEMTATLLHEGSIHATIDLRFNVLQPN